MLLGTTPLLIRSSALVFPTWTFVDDINANNVNISGGAGIAAGDVAFLLDGPSSSAAITKVIPSGWTEEMDQALDLGFANASRHTRTTISSKILVSGDLTAGALNAITGANGDQTDRKIVLIFRPSSPITTLTVLDKTQECLGNNGNVAQQTISMAAETVPVVAVANFRTSVAVNETATGMTGVSGSATTHAAAYRIFNSSQADQNVDLASDVGWSHLQSFYFKGS